MLNLQVKLNYKSMIQYVLLFLLISFQKGAFARALGNGFLVLVLGISILFVLKHKNIVMKNSLFFMILYLSFCLMMLTMLTTGGSLSLTTIMRYIICFLFVFVAIKIDEKNFLQRYLKLVYVISVVSIITYLLFAVLNVPLYSMFHYNNGYYGLFLFNFNPTSANVMRNIGISNEPGQFQIIVSSALYFSLFKYKFETQKKFIRYVFVFIVTLITIQSTTGYFALLAILGSFIFSRSDNGERKRVKRLIGLLIVGGIVYVGVNWGDSNFITVNFTDKVFSDDYSINLNQNTGGARVQSIMTDLSMAKDYPLGMGFQLYEYLWYEYAPANAGYLSCSGITRDIAIIGFLPVMLFFILIIKGLWINKISKMDFILGMFLLVNTGLAQTQSLNPCLMIIAMYPLVPLGNAKREKVIIKVNQKKYESFT